MGSPLRPLHRCMVCLKNEAQVILYQQLELCLWCLKDRISPIEPGKKFEITISVVDCGYDYEEEDNG